MEEFSNIGNIINAMKALGASSFYCKPLAENDNTKQQVYLGGSFEVLKQLPFSEIRSDTGVKIPNFKASIYLSWINTAGQAAQAPGAQLILYPEYPEVRLSGFLRGCSLAPSKLMQPVAKELRQHSNGPDGRYLFFGITPDRKILAYLSATGSAVSSEAAQKTDNGTFSPNGVLFQIFDEEKIDSRTILLEHLREIHRAGWHNSIRLSKDGNIMPYTALNGGGYTLEALLGVKPNGESAPDFMGWEIKAYGKSRITLMTPEPDSGFYGENGVAAFVRKYGRKLPNDVLYFTGTHKVGQPCKASGQTLSLDGFDVNEGKITKVDGGIHLIDAAGDISASWTFSGLISHWSRKHSAAAYVPYEKKSTPAIQYLYKSPVLLGTDTDFSFFLSSLGRGEIIYDPGSKITNASAQRSQVKARSQFRMNVRNLSHLYQSFEPVIL